MPTSEIDAGRSAWPRMFSRQIVTPKTEVRLGVGVVIWDREGRVLLERRSDCGWWGLVGGSLEVGESIQETALREAKEETGLDVRITGLIGVYSEPALRIVTYPDRADGVQLVDVVVEGIVNGGSLRCSEESLELRFFHRHELPETIVPPSQMPLDDAFVGRRHQVR